jgi:hypothetical protein
VEELKPRRAFFTHICHDLPHEQTNAALPPHVRLAYDGLEIDVDNDADNHRENTAKSAGSDGKNTVNAEDRAEPAN